MKFLNLKNKYLQFNLYTERCKSACFSRQNIHQKNYGRQGFTLVETLIAIFIFSMSITALFALSGTTTNSGQYSKNDIIATYLAQEAVDIIRNDRDSIIFQKFNQGGSTDWSGFVSKYNSCFDSNLGCEIDAFTKSVYPCSGFDDTGAPACTNINIYRNTTPTGDIDYYGIEPLGIITPIEKTSFRRKIVLYNNPNGIDSLVAVVTITWKNGESNKTKVFTETLYDWYK